MRAAVFRAPGSIEVQDVATPAPAAGEARVRVAFCGVCGSDLHRFRGDLPLITVTPGHEISGVVDSVGPGVSTLSAGDRVCIEPILPCGTCRYCSTGHHQLCVHARYLAGDVNGGFAEYVVLPATRVGNRPAIQLGRQQRALRPRVVRRVPCCRPDQRRGHIAYRGRGLRDCYPWGRYS